MEPIITMDHITKEFKILNKREGLRGSIVDLFSRNYKTLKAVNDVTMSIMPGEINFSVDFFVGIICFYTQSVWGVNIMKEVLVALLSGATIPLAFFPSSLRKVVDILPFQAIYNSPLQILIDTSLSTRDYIDMLIHQFFWVVLTVAFGRIFWIISKKKITVNGG